MTWCFRAIKPDKEFIEYCRNHLLDKQKAKNPELEKIIDDIGEQIKSLKHEVGNLGYKIKNQRQEINNLLKENATLKELLKEWLLFAEEENPKDFTVISERMQELAQQTNGLLGEE